MPKVSVIIPAYNREKLISRAINSVLGQTYQDYEIIVVDDGSTDTTKDIVMQFQNKVKYFRQENQGSAAARNRGIQESQGEYIAFLDSDDYWVPEKLEEQVKVLDAQKNVGIVYARMPIINEKGERLGTKPAGISGKNFKELLEVWGDLPTSTVMTRRECFDKAGMFDPALTTMQDIDMWLRIARFYDLHEIEGKVLAYYFRHSEQATASRIKVYDGLVKIYQKILRIFDNAPRELFVKRIAMNQYTLSREYYFEGFYLQSLQNVTASILHYPSVGMLFFYAGDNLFVKILKIIKPYGFWMVCFFRVTVQALFDFFKKPKKVIISKK